MHQIGPGLVFVLINHVVIYHHTRTFKVSKIQTTFVKLCLVFAVKSNHISTSNFVLSFFRDVINLETTEPLNDVYFNFKIWTNPTVWRPIKKKLLKSGYNKTPFAEYPEYYRVLANHTFVISPPGTRKPSWVAKHCSNCRSWQYGRVRFYSMAISCTEKISSVFRPDPISDVR